MLTFTTELGDRTSRELPLTLAEASQMAEADSASPNSTPNMAATA